MHTRRTRTETTTDQITRLTEYITEGFNLGMHTGTVLLDTSAAFDTVWTTGLLYKMAKMEFSRGIIKLLKSYLTGRSFYVTVEGETSSVRPVAQGTPQGSILGPALFITYVNDIPRPARVNLAMFADDTAIYYRHQDSAKAVRYLQRALEELLQYFRRWRLRINSGKTEPVLFTKRLVTGEQENYLHIDGVPLRWKDAARFLGVHLDRRLNMGAHLTAIKKKARAAMSILYPLVNRRSKLSPALKVRLAQAYVRPILTYAAPAWAGMLSDTRLHGLQVQQNKYLRMALGKPRHTRIRDLHAESRTPYLGDFIVQSLRSYYAKVATNSNPLIAGLGQYSPETAPYRMKHKTPKHRLFTLDA